MKHQESLEQADPDQSTGTRLLKTRLHVEEHIKKLLTFIVCVVAMTSRAER